MRENLLVTTSIEESWDENSYKIILGSWHYLKSDKEIDKNGCGYEAASQYVVDSKTKQEHYKYIGLLSNRLIQDLTTALNMVHGTSYSSRYWKILLGTWTHKILAILFNRWMSVKSVLENCNVDKTIILKIPKEEIIPEGYADFANIVGNVPEWDHMIYGEILKNWTDIHCEEKGYNFLRSKNSHKSSKGYKNIIKLMLKSISSVMNLFSSKKDGVLFSTYLPVWNKLKLQISLGQIPLYRSTPKTQYIFPNHKARKYLIIGNKSESDFEEFARKILSEQIPTCYLEGYERLKNSSKSLNWPQNPRFIFTSNAFDGNEFFKCWTAEKVDQGTPYIIGQHGGQYGIAEFTPSERYEIDICDRYLTWGWTNGIKTKPAFMFNKSRKVRHYPKGGLLLVGRVFFNNVTPWNEILEYEKYLEDQSLLASLLPINIKKRLSIRLYPGDRMADQIKNNIWNRRHPEVVVDVGERSMKNLVNNSRLIVHSYNGTGMLEHMSQNIPILIFWNEEYSVIRESAKSHFNELKKVGIFHTDPESISNKIAEIWEDVEGWWNQESVQTVRVNFCKEYANSEGNFTHIMKELLLTVQSSEGKAPVKQL